MKKMRRSARTLAAALLCLGLLSGGALADVTTPVSEGTEISREEFIKSQELPFPDVPKDAAYAQAVLTLTQMGIVTGDEKGNFNPNATISRAETAAIVCRVMGVEEDAKAMTNAVFDDVPASHWAVGYVAKAAELGIINGYGDGRFGPADPVTYEQMVKMLVCVWGWETEAKQAGGWPNGYLQIADLNGYTEGIQQSSTDEIARSTVSRLIYNSLGEK